jgi:hypothetical protein
MKIDSARIIESLLSHKLVDGLTHSLYSYPARFSPELAREVINIFSSSGDWVFDPFMGGGTSIVESLVAGRYALGVDINSLAWFVALTKTTPISSTDIVQLREWSKNISSSDLEIYPSLNIEEFRRHFPKRFLKFLDRILDSSSKLKSQNAKRVARFVLLKVYQGLLSERDGFPSSIQVKQKTSVELEKLFLGLNNFWVACNELEVSKSEVISRRKLLNRSSIGIEADGRVRDILRQPRLVFTSPPYPGVHVLYNKWQIASRKETFLPYYISGMNDSQSEAYYTLGGRSRAGVSKYFDLITQSFFSISKVINLKAIVAQLVGFSDTRIQLPLYLKAMEAAGYKEVFPLSSNGKRLWRNVPNRKWYTNGRDRWDASREVLLTHTLNHT